MQLLRWFLANALLPIFAPVLFISVVSWFEDGSFPIGDVFQQLIKSGFYVFSALALVFSLLEDYPILKLSGLGPLIGAFSMLVVIATLYMFYLIQTKDASYVKDHILQFSIVWVLTALLAFYIKRKLIVYKQTNATS